jgi:hypothetical protein
MKGVAIFGNVAVRRTCWTLVLSVAGLDKKRGSENRIPKRYCKHGRGLRVLSLNEARARLKFKLELGRPWTVENAKLQKIRTTT